MNLSHNTTIVKNSRSSFTIHKDLQAMKLSKTEIINIISYAINVVLCNEEKEIFYKKLKDAVSPYTE